MKIKCNQDYWPAKTGVLGVGVCEPEKIDGLTLGKTYDASPVFNEGYVFLGSIDITIKFLIYDDNEEWNSYQLNLFEPI